MGLQFGLLGFNDLKAIFQHLAVVRFGNFYVVLADRHLAQVENRGYLDKGIDIGRGGIILGAVLANQSNTGIGIEPNFKRY